MMDTCGLTLTNREEILGKLRSLKLDLAQRYAISQIGVFGSVSRAEATEASDIDRDLYQAGVVYFCCEKPGFLGWGGEG